jgi:TonB family protein
MIVGLFAVGVGLLLGQARASDVAPSDLAAAKALYASASYEEALSRLSTAPGPEDLDQIEQYRALCLLALGRSTEAERTIERIVSRRPLYTATDAEVSPRLVTMLHDVRKRLLPVAARGVYAKAKADFDDKNYQGAVDGFNELLAIVADPDTADARAALADLKQLGEGFLKLATIEVAAAAKAAAAPPASAPVQTAPQGPATYSADDSDVTPPVELQRTMPVWTPNLPTQARIEFRGTLEIVVDEDGHVASAAIRKSTTPGYDAALLDAAKSWRYRAATKSGQPVRYRTFIDVVLKPGDPASR